MRWLGKLLPGRAPVDDGLEPSVRPHPVPALPECSIAPAWTTTTPTLRSEGFAGVTVEPGHQDALRRHLDASRPLRYVVAQLTRDPAGDDLPGAVSVRLGDDVVGHIMSASLDADQSLHAALDLVALRGLPATCWARLHGGSTPGADVGMTLLTGCYNDSVEPFPFTLTVPPHSWGPLLGVEQHQELLERFVGQGDEAVVGCTLTIADANPARSGAGGPVLLAAIGGTVVGGMSARESAQRLSIVQALLDAERPVLAMARVRRGAGEHEGFSSSVSTVVP